MGRPSTSTNMDSPRILNLLCGESPLPLLPSSPIVSEANPSIHVGPTTIDVKPIVDKVLLNDHRVFNNMLKDEIMAASEIKDYFDEVQTQLKPHMRKIVTDWMLEVCEDQQCQPQVFFLAVSYLDRFLSSLSITKTQFQLLASVCILLASKFSQVVPITTEQLVIYTDNSISKQELKHWEMEVLNVLQWELSTSTVNCFLNLLYNCFNISDKVQKQCEALAIQAVTEY